MVREERVRVFIAIGVVGVLLIALALVFDDLFEGLLGDVEFGGDWLSTTAIASFLAAFGFAAAVLQRRFGVAVPLAAAGGTVAGVGLAALAIRWSRSLSSMATDATPAASDLVGCAGKVVTEIPAGTSGEVLVRLGGQPVKLSAIGPATTLDRGTDIVVVEVLSPTRVRVERTESFWS